MRDYKTTSAIVAHAHAKIGTSIVPLEPPHPDRRVLVSLVEPAEVVGRELSAKKQVRAYLWKHRRSRAVNRRSAVVWSVYLEQPNVSLIGLGALTTRGAADRLVKKHSSGPFKILGAV